MHQNKTGYSLAALDDDDACWWFWSQFPLYTLALFDWSNIDTKFDLLARFRFSNILPLFSTVQTQNRKQNPMKLFNEPNGGRPITKRSQKKSQNWLNLIFCPPGKINIPISDTLVFVICHENVKVSHKEK